MKHKATGFGYQYYPTPPYVAEIISDEFCEPEWALSGLRWLEPSAGKGDLAKHVLLRIAPNGNWVLVEKSPILSSYLREHCPLADVVEGDFLSITPDERYHAIVMNPPFAIGVQHVLHAWKMLLPGGRLVALLNAATFAYDSDNGRSQAYTPWNNRRALLDLVTLHGKVEMLGRVFSDSEHATDVDVTLVVLNKPQARSESVGSEFERPDFDIETDDDTADERQPLELVTTNEVGALIARYKACRVALERRNEADLQFGRLLQPIDPKRTGPKRIDLKVDLNDLRKTFWQHVFSYASPILATTTAGFKAEWDERVAIMERLSFTERNISIIAHDFILNYGEYMEKAISELFDRATSFHKDNRVEGWAHNSGWRVNVKIIMPYATDNFSSHWRLNWHGNTRDFLEDIDKALAWIEQRDLSHVRRVVPTIERRFDELNRGTYDGTYSDEIITTYFTIRVYKNGNIHLRFNDRDVWQEFNRRAALGKGWLSDGHEGVARNTGDEMRQARGEQSPLF